MSECWGCLENWPLGKFGCHYEPKPDDWDDDVEWYGQQNHCSNWRMRRAEFRPISEQPVASERIILGTLKSTLGGRT